VPPLPKLLQFPPPLVAKVMVSQHEMRPADVGASGALNYDVESSGTGPEHRAPYGDSYNINLFERPFTQTGMNYIPLLDILTFQISEDRRGTTSHSIWSAAI
jgi:hypothetical protein